ncbi:MAG TPA: hypothetical protein VGC39_09675 [Candidatus Methylacidiphilales bacterium]
MALQVQQKSLAVNLSNEIEGHGLRRGQNLEEVVIRLRALVNEINVGARDMHGRFAEVIQGGRTVARITYNGTVLSHLGS